MRTRDPAKKTLFITRDAGWRLRGGLGPTMTDDGGGGLKKRGGRGAVVGETAPCIQPEKKIEKKGINSPGQEKGKTNQISSDLTAKKRKRKKGPLKEKQ